MVLDCLAQKAKSMRKSRTKFKWAVFKTEKTNKTARQDFTTTK